MSESEDIIIKVGQIWRMTEAFIRQSLKEIAVEHPEFVDYELDAFSRILFNIKLKILKIDQDDIDETKTFVTVIDVGPEEILKEEKNFHVGHILIACELDEFNAA